MRLERLTLRNFLSVRDASVDLRPVNILIGENNAGKSNLIDAISLLQAAPSDLLPVMRRGGAIRDWIGKGERLSGVGASVGCNVDGAHWDMEFADGPGLVISRESLNENALPSNPAVESIPRKDEVNGLKGATRDTQKGVYHTTRHAPDLLMNLDREK